MSDSAHKTDEELACEVQAGDSSAFEGLMKRYEERLLRYGRRYLVRTEDIEDVVQDVFLKTYENINSYNSSYRFSPWIYRIAHNTFVNVLRKQSRQSFEFFDFDTIIAPLSGITVEEKDIEMQSEALEKYLERIAPKYREVLILYYFEELSYDEIAEVLHVPIGTVGVRLRRAREALKKVCGKPCNTYE